MSSINVKMNPAILTVLLAGAERLYQRDKYATLRVAALMERLVKEEDLGRCIRPAGRGPARGRTMSAMRSKS